MAIRLSERVGRIEPSVTIAVSMRAADLRRAGRDVIGLGAGEPDFDTPEHIKQAAWEAMQAGQTKYTPVDGILELRQAIVDKMKRDHNLEYALDEVMTNNGAKHTLMNVLESVIQAGDQVIIPAPFWASYADMVRLVDGEPVIIGTGPDQKFKLRPEQLEGAITSNSRLIIINSPSNPTGQAYTRAEWEALAEVLRQHEQLTIVTDEIYEHIYWGEEPYCSLLMACPDLKDRTLVINGASKAYAMTGWRIGYAAGPKELVKTMKKVQSQMSGCPCSISQAATVAALNGDQGCIATMLEAFKQRHDRVLERLNQLPGVHCLPADGAFYLFASFEGAIERITGVNSDLDLAEWLLEKADVAMVPGTAFGQPGYLRLSFATSMENLDKALDRLEKVLPAA